jgi:hypothetical protein
MSQPPAYAGHPAVAENPGKTLGIVALVAAFFISVLGIILGIVALNQSKKAGFSNGPAKAAIIVGIVVTVLWILGVILAFVLGAAALSAFTEMCAELGSGSHTVDGVTYTCS